MSQQVEQCQSSVGDDILQIRSSIRPLSEWANDLGVDSQLWFEIHQAFGSWWLRTIDSCVAHYQNESLVDKCSFVGLWSALSETLITEPSSSLSTPAIAQDKTEVLSEVEVVSKRSDVERIEKLIRANTDRLRGLKFRWFLGSVFEIILESKPAMRVVRERGILLSDVERAIRLIPKFSQLIPADGLTTRAAVMEMRRLHRARIGYLWLDQSDSTQPRISSSVKKTREQKQHQRSYGHAEYSVGEVVWVALNETKNGKRSFRRHPALLLGLTGRKNDKWVLVSLTSDVEGNPEYRKVTQFQDLGLTHSGYVWHETQKVYRNQIESHIGWVTDHLIKVVDASINLRQSQISELRTVAALHHSSESLCA